MTALDRLHRLYASRDRALATAEARVERRYRERVNAAVEAVHREILR
jgi:hypothetical protein